MAHRRRIAAFAAEEQGIDARRHVRHLAGVLLEERRGEPQRRNLFSLQERAQLLGGQQGIALHTDQAAAVQERAPDLAGGGVERDIRHLGNALAGTQLEVAVVENQPHHAALRGHHPFGLAGRAGGVDQVGRRLAAEGRRQGALCRRRAGEGGFVGHQHPAAARFEGKKRHQVGQLFFGHQQPRARILEQETQPFGRVAGVERQ